MNGSYKANRAPLKSGKYSQLSLGDIKPRGWLRDQLAAQAKGLGGHADEFYFKNEYWLGGDGGSMMTEAGRSHIPIDWFRGLFQTAYILEDPALIEKARGYIEYLISSAREDGSFGPQEYMDCAFPDVGNTSACFEGGRLSAAGILLQYYGITGDERILKMLHHFVVKYYGENIQQDFWTWFNGMGRGGCRNLGAALYNITGDRRCLDAMLKFAGRKTPENRWKEDFLEGKLPVTHGAAVAGHVGAMATDYMYTGDEDCKLAADKVIAYLEKEQGQVGGHFTGHEFIAEENGTDPTHGSELCLVLGYIRSMMSLFAMFGDNSYADRCEELVFNSFPAAMTGDMWAHQYDQQVNQVLSTVGRRRFDNKDDANIYGLKPHYPCCLASLANAWPAFIQGQWMATQDGGLIALSYCPVEVKALVADGVPIRLTVDSEYPFRGGIEITVNVDQPVEFPLYLRAPNFIGDFGERMGVMENGIVRLVDPLENHVVRRVWKNGDKITINIPMNTRFIKRSDATAAVKRGPLYYALRVDEEYKQLKHYYKGSVDWEIYPKSAWNVGLFSTFRAAYALVVEEHHPIPKLPFAHKGEMIYNEETDSFERWNEPEPVILKARGHIISNWGLHRIYPMADKIKPDAEREYGQPVTVELIPYGCTNLRVAEFPYIL